MVYWLVGSRDLDGGLMCTASHNPKAYTGAKMVERGSVALSGDRGLAGDPRPHRERPRRRPRRRLLRGGRHLRGLPARGAEGHRPERDQAAEGRRSTAATAWRGRWSARSCETPAARAGRDLLGPGRRVPRPRAEPAAAREPRVHRAQGDRDRRRPRHRLGRRRRPLLLLRRRRRVRPRRLPDRAAGGVACWRRSRARTSSTTCAPRARCRTRSTRLGGRALVNRVGHAFFKTRMRDEGGEFGGEVSGHYYFKAFYNADSGTIPALLILELLSKRETTLAELLADLRSKYFISGEINSTVADQQAKMDEIKAALRRRRDHRARRRLDRLRGLALQRPPVEHRAAAAPEPREPDLPGGHGAPARRAAGADPVVIHRLPIPTPFRVGRVNCLPDRRRPADAGRRRAELGRRAGRARGRACARPAAGSRTSSGSSSPTSTPTTSGWSASSPTAPAPRSARWTCFAPLVEDFASYADRNDELAQAVMRRHGDRATTWSRRWPR